MYESPIELITTQISAEFDEGVLKCIRSFYPKIDENELMKALRYDRRQYDKGYADGYAEGAKEVADRLKQWVIESSNYWFSCSVNAEIDDVLEKMINK